MSEREKREKDEKLQAELKLQKIKEQQKLMEAERMRNESVTALSRKREAVYKSILDTTSDFDTVEEKKRKKSLDSKMSDNLDKPLSKRNLGDILAAINHFDTGKSQKREIEKQEKEEGVKQETFG